MSRSRNFKYRLPKVSAPCGSGSATQVTRMWYTQESFAPLLDSGTRGGFRSGLRHMPESVLLRPFCKIVLVLRLFEVFYAHVYCSLEPEDGGVTPRLASDWFQINNEWDIQTTVGRYIRNGPKFLYFNLSDTENTEWYSWIFWLDHGKLFCI
jgi:hypothetical protein